MLYVVAFGTIMFFQFPIAIVMSLTPRHRYVPKRLRYRTKFKKKWAQLVSAWGMITITYGRYAMAMEQRWSIASTMENDRTKASRPMQRTMMAFPSIATNQRRPNTKQMFDASNTDSFTIVIDIACSYCITNDLKHYVRDRCFESFVVSHVHDVCVCV